MTNATDLVFQIIILLMSVVIHEVSHGAMAYGLGDKTAKYHGRLTLNPIPHLDPFGSVLLPLLLVITKSPILIGWAKPVPYNPYNLRNQKWGPALVGFAGPLSNLLIAVFFGLFIRAANFGVFGFIPHATLLALGSFAINVALINISLAVFNLMPIPPLDGSKVLAAIVPYRWADALLRLESMGFIILIAFIFFFSWIVSPISAAIFHIITGI